MIQTLLVRLFHLIGILGLVGNLTNPLMVHAVPEKVRPHHSYYSDDFSRTGEIAELAEEKNYEEVYQFYNYYEAIYNEQKRVISFKAYKQGDIEWQEQYFYDNTGKLVKKIVDKTDQPQQIIEFQ